MYRLTLTIGLFGTLGSLYWAVKNQELQMIQALIEQLDVQVPELELLSSSTR